MGSVEPELGCPTVDMRELPWPAHLEEAGCAAMVSTGVTTGPQNCVAPPAATVLVRTGRAEAFRAFLCAKHAEQVPVAEPMSPQHERELEFRHRQHARALAGQRYLKVLPVVLPPNNARGTASRMNDAETRP